MTTATARVRRVHTARMTLEELARVWAAHHGLQGRTGGWLYLDGRPVCHGYTALGAYLQRQQVLVPGVGIDWLLDTRRGGARQARTLAAVRTAGR